MNRVLISATGSGRGKTTIVSGLLYSLNKDQGNVHAFKCGPDYIDPMFHRAALGVASNNLDPFFGTGSDKSTELLRSVFIENAGELNIIEGAMGLYDGMGTTRSYSAYTVAEALDAPIVLIVDAHGMAYSIIAEIKGFMALDNRKLIKGVILNQISDAFAERMIPVIEKECAVKVIGHVPKLKNVEFSSRHLGLTAPEENDIKDKLELLYTELSKRIDFEALKLAAQGAKELSAPSFSELFKSYKRSSVKLAVARDEAFSFIYEDNIKVLKEMGAEIIYFSPIRDKILPDADGLILYGGYPELYKDELSANTEILSDIKAKYEKGLPIMAECGGFMYLFEELRDEDKTCRMLGILKGHSFRTKGLVRFGYVNVKVGGASYPGHEFHHYDVTDVGDAAVIESVSKKTEYAGMHLTDKLSAGFPHMYYPAAPDYAAEFLKKADNYKNNR